MRFPVRREPSLTLPLQGRGPRSARGDGAPSLAKGGLSAPASLCEAGLGRKGGFTPLAGAPIKRARIIAAARGWIGTPYLHQASAKDHGTDCLGLIRGLWRELYASEPEVPPPYTPDWNERAFARGAEPLLAAARRHLVERPLAARLPGDVLVFRVVRDGPAKHCGVMTAPDRFAHAYAGRAVVESWLARWWIERLVGVFEFPGVKE